MVSVFYPMLCVDDVAESVNFYEDNFNFVPTYEDDSFVKLALRDNKMVVLTIVDANHPDIPQEYRHSTKNVILNFPVEDVSKKYDELYMDGVTVYSRPGIDSCGYPHFFVRDPGGNLIDVMQKDFPVGSKHYQYTGAVDRHEDVVCA